MLPINKNIIVCICLILMPLSNPCSENVEQSKMLTYEQADSLYNLLDQANYSSMTTELETLGFSIPQDQTDSSKSKSDADSDAEPEIVFFMFSCFKKSTPHQPHKYQDANSNTVLHHACNAGHVKLAEKMLNLGNSVDDKNNDDETPLFYAQNYDVIKLLEEKGTSFIHQNNQNQIPLIQHIQRNDFSTTKIILECMRSLPNDALSKAKQLPFSYAKSLEMINILAYYQLCAGTTQQKQHVKVNNASRMLCNMYSSMNVQPNINIKDHSDNTLLHIAVQHNHPGVALMLLHKNIDINAQNKFRQTALHLAAARNLSSFINLLIYHAAYLESQDTDNKKSQLLETKDADHATALMVAVRENKVDAAFQLIATGANIFTCNKFGHTLLHFVKDPVLAQKLIDMGLDVNSKGRYKHTPLHFSANEHVAQIFINNQADIHAKTIDGNSPLHYPKTLAVAKALIDARASIDSKNALGRTPLHCAAQRKKTTRCKLLIDHNANINTPDIYGNKPAMLINYHHNNMIFALEDMFILFGVSSEIIRPHEEEIETKLANTSYMEKVAKTLMRIKTEDCCW